MNENAKNFPLKNIWPYACLFLILFWFYFDLFIVRGAWLVADHAEQHFPWAHYLAENLKAGRLPFWTDLIHAGFPVTAEGQIGSFYVPNLILYYFLPIEQGYAWGIVLHLLLSAFFMFHFMRTLGIGRLSSLFGTLVYLFGSTLGGAYYNITCLKVMTWFPLVLIGIDRILKTSGIRWLWIWVIGILFAFQLLVGYLQYAAYAVLFAFIYAFFRSFDHTSHWIKNGFRILAHLIPSVIISAIVSLPQLWMTYELAVRSNRAVTEEGFAYVGSYSPFALICLLFPSMEGLFVSKLYLGIFPLFFILLSFFLWKRIPHRAVYWIAGVAFLLALGRFSPLYVGIVKLFNFYSFRTPVKFIFFAGFFLTVLMAMAYDYWLRAEVRDQLIKAVKTYGAILAAALGAVYLGYWIFHAFENQLYDLGAVLVRRFIYGTPGHPFDWPHYEERIHSFIGYAQHVFQPTGKVVLAQLWKILAAVVFLIFLIRRKMPLWFIHAIAFVLIIWDLNFAYSDIRGDYMSYEKFYKTGETTTYLQQNLGSHRFFNFSKNTSEAPLPASKNMIWHLPSVNAYSPLVMSDYYEFFNSLGGVNDSVASPPLAESMTVLDKNKLRTLDVRYIVTDRSLPEDLFSLRLSDGIWNVYENLDETNYAFLVPAFKTLQRKEGLVEFMSEENLDLQKTVLLQGEPDFSFKSRIKSSAPTNNNSLRIIKRYEEEKIFEINAAEDMMLFISQIYYPGWRAWVDGIEAPVVAANGIFTGIPVPAGSHKVLFRFDPFHTLKAKMREMFNGSRTTK